MSAAAFNIEPVQYADIPAIAKISATAFVGDSHTEMKDLATVPYDMEKLTIDTMPATLNNPRAVLLKAVDPGTREIMGYISWIFVGFEPDEIPVVEGAPPKGAAMAGASQTTKEEPEEDLRDECIKELAEKSDGFMADFQHDIMPPGTKCLIVASLNVAPQFQRRGVGSALLKWGLDVVDEKGVFAWTSSSDGAVGAYAKCGFDVVRSLTVSLDDYAPIPAPDNGRYKDGKWGDYTWWKMVYRSPGSERLAHSTM